MTADRPGKAKNEARDFGGVMLSTDPHDLAPGEAQDQVNMKSDRVGAMETRSGVRTVSFDSTV